jgi:TrmH family RNA methyltransferase
VTALRAAGLQVVAADAAGHLTLDEAQAAGELAQPTAWVFGNEAWGLPGGALALCDMVVRVPIYGRAESLNLATAAAVCLYASARTQRSSELPRTAPDETDSLPDSDTS